MKHVVVHLVLDRESLDALKTLLRRDSVTCATWNESHEARMNRESLKRVFDQLRDAKYDDLTLPASLDYE